MTDYLELAREMRAKIDASAYAVKTLIRVDELDEEELENIMGLYDDWEDSIGEKMVEGELIRYKGELYKALESHTIDEGYNPEETNYRYVLATPKETIDYWVKPEGYESVYDEGAKVIYKPDNKTYVSKIDGNSQEPTKDEPHNRYWEVVE